MNDAAALIVGALLHDDAGISSGGDLRTTDAMADNVVIVERKIWTAPNGNQGEWVDSVWVDSYPPVEPTQSHVQDTWWLSTYTHDRLTGKWTQYIYARTHGKAAPIPCHDIGPIERPRRGPHWDAGRPIPRCLLDGATWENINPRGIYPEGDRRFRPLDNPTEITMSVGFLEINVSEFLLDAPWYVTALAD